MTTLSLDGYQYARAFKCLQEIDLDSLDHVEDKSCALPFLTKLLLNPFFARRKTVLDIVYKLPRANDMVQLLQVKPIEPHELANGQEVISESAFESGSARDRIKTVATEYLRLCELTRSPPPSGANQAPATTSTHTKLQKSNIFDNPLYLDHISLCLYAMLNRVSNTPVINLLDLIETLLHLKHGPVLILHLVLNMPDRCQEVCQSLVSLSDGIEGDGAPSNEISDNRVASLRAICRLNPAMVFKVRALSIRLRLIPSISLVLSLDQLSDGLERLGKPGDDQEPKCPRDLLKITQELEQSYESALTFVIGILQDEHEATRTWFARYIKTAQQKRGDQNHDSTLAEFRSQVVLTMRRLLAVFFEEDIQESIKDFKLTDDAEESEERFLERKLLQATATLRYFSCLRGLGMIKLNQDESESLLNLITCKLAQENETSANQIKISLCTLLVCSSIMSTHKEERRAADWMKWLWESKELGEGSLSELLSQVAANFDTNQINQISEFVCSTLGMKMQIKPFISKCKSLVLHDVFNFQRPWSSPSGGGCQKEAAGDPETEKRKSQVVSGAAAHQAPIKDWIYKKIFEHDEALRVEIVGIRPKSISQERVEGLKAELAAAFTEMSADPARLLRLVTRILKLPRDDIWTFIEVYMQHWFGILELETNGDSERAADNKRLVKALTKLWWRFNTVQPRELWVMTINSLKRAQPLKPYAELHHTWDELAYDPLIVLKCDSRVFRNSRLIDIVLHILSAFLEVSKQFLQEQVDEAAVARLPSVIEELKVTLVSAQTSAAIQILLEFCLPDEAERRALSMRAQKEDNQKHEHSHNQDKDRTTSEHKENLLTPLGDETTAAHHHHLLATYDESVDCICQHLHQVFIADTNLAKLVHFQTYPSDLLAITTDKVPSMHICLDYIPELLSQPDLPKQVFVIQLTSHLCEKYAITKSLNCAKLCFNAAFTLLQLLPSDKRALFYVPALPALLRICRVFPILQEDARLILNQVYQVTWAHMASTPSRLSLSAANPFEGLDKLSWSEVEGLMRNLSLDESLFLCTQKCLIDLDQMELADKQQQQSCDQRSLMIENAQRPAYNTIFAYGSHVI